ncbi:MAG: ABC transporter ATP-binding protein [Treponemataceae bacterium]
MSSLIELQGVSRIYQMGEEVVRALNGVSFCINAGEFVSIMGPSGSGKSTCMNMIGCLDTPSSGDVIINNKKTRFMNEKELAVLRNQTVGFVFQQYHLLSSLTVLENVMLPLRYQKMPIEERKEKAFYALDKMGLSDRLNHRPSELSGGQKQRVAIARATVTQPKIILADEPTGALDSETGHSVINLFHQINKEGTTIIIITHDHLIGNATPRTLHILDGIIKEDSDNNQGGEQ